MTTPIAKSTPFQPVINPAKVLHRITANSNDPSQSVKRDGPFVTISGVGSNNGIMASCVTVTFDNRSVTVPVSKGQTAQQTQDAISKALPAGYGLMPIRMFGDSVNFQILKNPTVDVAASFEAAQAPTKTQERSQVTKGELTKIVNGLKKDGFTADEGQKLADAWAGLFNGAKWNATPAAQKEYAKLQAQFDLPTRYVR